MLGASGLIASGVEAMSADERERALFGLMALANRVLVADHADAGSIESHTRAIERAGAYVGVALEARGATDGATAAPSSPRSRSSSCSARDTPEPSRSRCGRATIQGRLGRRHAKALDLIDAPLDARVRALLLARPLYVSFEGVETDAVARDFKSLAEFDETRVTLELCEALGETLLTRRGWTAAAPRRRKRPFEETPRFSTLLLTALAWLTTRGELRIDRLPSDLVADFLRTTASRRTADPEAPARAMARLIEALAAESDLPRRPAATLRAFGTTCLDRLAADCGNLDPGTPATPRVVGCLRLA